MKIGDEIVCKLHGRTTETFVMTVTSTGETLGVFCGRCVADFLKQHLGECEVVKPEKPR